MAKYYLMAWLSLAAIAFAPGGRATAQEIMGVYQENISIYSDKGRKIREITIRDDDIRGTEVLEITSRMLVRVNFRGEEIWLRASQLKFSLPVTAKCPEKAPGRPDDLTTPVASGIGDCK